MKKIILGVLLLSLGIAYFIYPRKIRVDFVKEYDLKENPWRQSALLLTESESVIAIAKEPRENLSKVDIKSFMINLDFANYNYLISFGREIKSLRTSPYISNFVDEASNKGIPFAIDYKTEGIAPKVYVYRLGKKPFRRPICC
jgi:hypothetical protein